MKDAAVISLPSPLPCPTSLKGEGRKHGAFMNPRVIPTCNAFLPGEKELNLQIKHTTLEPYSNGDFSI